MMNVLFKRILLAAALLCAFSLTVNAQESKHEVSVWGGAGLGMAAGKKSVLIDKKSNKMGPMFGVGYMYSITEQLGIQTGIEYSFYKSELTMNGLSASSLAIDSDGDHLEYVYKVTGYKEKQELGLVQIPIMAQYQIPVLERANFYAAAGVKIGFAASKKLKGSMASLVTEGHYDNVAGGVIIDEHTKGFGTFNNVAVKQDLKLKTAVLLALEAGMKWELMDGMALYTGAYFDYGLNTLNKGKSSFVEYNVNDPQHPTVNGVSQKAGQETGIVSRIKPMAVGLKVKLAFGL